MRRLRKKGHARRAPATQVFVRHAGRLRPTKGRGLIRGCWVNKGGWFKRF